MHFSKFHLSKKWQTTSLVMTVIISIFAVAMVISGYYSVIPYDEETKQPHILILLLGDIGFSDVSWHNPGVKSPNMQALRDDATKLTSYYTHPLSSKSRVELLTGMYWHRWKGDLKSNNSGTTLAERLKKLGYTTQYIGKWQIDEYSPVEMGFDSFYGSSGDNIDSWTKCRQASNGTMVVDWKGMSGEEDLTRSHVNDLITNYTVTAIEGRNNSGPLFLVVSFIPPKVTRQTPEKYKDKFRNRKDVWRQEFLAYVQHLDASISTITTAFAELWDRDSYTIAISDGGHPSSQSLSSRYPLRGGPGSVFEGGIKVPAFISGGYAEDNTLNTPFHVTDWMPTIMRLALSPLNSTNDDHDGKDKTPDLGLSEGSEQEQEGKGSEGADSCRVIIHSIESPPFSYTGYYPSNLTTFGNVSAAAISCWPFKLVLDIPGINDEWVENKVIKALRSPSQNKALAYEYWSIGSKDSKCNGSMVIGEYEQTQSAKIHQKTPNIYLFNIEDDPEETENISPQETDMVNNLLNKLKCHDDFISFPLTAR